MLARAGPLVLAMLLALAFPADGTAMRAAPATVELLLTGVDDGVVSRAGGIVAAGQWSWLDATVLDLQGVPIADTPLVLDIRVGTSSTVADGLTDSAGRVRALVPAAGTGEMIVVRARAHNADMSAAWAAGAPLENATPATWIRPEDAWTSVEVALSEPAIVSLVLHGRGDRPSEEASAGLYDLLFDLDQQNWSRWTGHGVSARSKDVSVRATSGTTTVAVAADLPTGIGATELSWGIHHNALLPAGTPIKLLLARAGLTGSDTLAVRIFVPPHAGFVRVLDEGAFHVAAVELNGTGVSTTDIAGGPIETGTPSLHRGSVKTAIRAPADSLVLFGGVSLHNGGGAFTLTRDEAVMLHREPPAEFDPYDGILQVGQGLCGGEWRATVDMPKFGSPPTLVLAAGDAMPLGVDWLGTLRPDCAFELPGQGPSNNP